MIHTLLLRFNHPGLYLAARALKELRRFVYSLQPNIRRAERINKNRDRLQDFLRKARSRAQDAPTTTILRAIEQISLLAEKDSAAARDYKLEGTQETVWFFNMYLSLLDALYAALSGSWSGSGPALRRSGGLIALGRKQLGLFKAGRLSMRDNFVETLKITALYKGFGAWLDESSRLLENIPSAGKHRRTTT